MDAGEEKKADCGKKKMKEGAGDGGRSEVSSRLAAGVEGCGVLVAALCASGIAAVCPAVFYQALQLHLRQCALKFQGCFLYKVVLL